MPYYDGGTVPAISVDACPLTVAAVMIVVFDERSFIAGAA